MQEEYKKTIDNIRKELPVDLLLKVNIPPQNNLKNFVLYLK